MCIYIYIYRERERDTYIHVYTTHTYMTCLAPLLLLRLQLGRRYLLRQLLLRQALLQLVLLLISMLLSFILLFIGIILLLLLLLGSPSELHKKGIGRQGSRLLCKEFLCLHTTPRRRTPLTCALLTLLQLGDARRGGGGVPPGLLRPRLLGRLHVRELRLDLGHLLRSLLRLSASLLEGRPERLGLVLRLVITTTLCLQEYL